LLRDVNYHWKMVIKSWRRACEERGTNELGRSYKNNIGIVGALLSMQATLLRPAAATGAVRMQMAARVHVKIEQHVTACITAAEAARRAASVKAAQSACDARQAEQHYRQGQNE